MDKLWAPWRKAYIGQQKRSGCFLCQIKKSKNDRANLVLKKTTHSIALLNLYPYNNGHVLVVPKRHVKSLELLSDVELLDLMKLNNEMTKRVRSRLKPHGMNMGINLGRISGAGVPGHVHIHIVPRWAGDTNFMPVVAQTKVISESLESAYKRLS